MGIPCRGQTRGTRARYTRKLYSSEDTPASFPGSHQRGALQEDIGRHSGVLRRRCRGAGLGYRESLVAEALREGEDGTESRWRSLAEAKPKAASRSNLPAPLVRYSKTTGTAPRSLRVRFSGTGHHALHRRTRAEAPTQGKRFGASWF